MHSDTKRKIAILADFPIGLIDHSHPEVKGHYTVWLVALFDSFKDQDDFEIHWVTLSKNVQKVQCKKFCNQYFHIIPRARVTIGLYSFYWYDRYHVAQTLKKIQPDLVHAWGTEDCYGLCGKDFKGRKLFSTQGLLRACCQLGSMSTYFQHQSLYEPRTFRAYRWITTESPWGAEWIKRDAPSANPIIWRYTVERRFWDRERSLTPYPSCLFGGTDSLIKNVDTLIRAFSRPELSHIQLNLAGVNPKRRKNLPANIHPLGYIDDRDEMAKLISETWCLVLPSFADADPNIVREARIMSVPVICSTQCGAKQYVEEGKSGYIHEPLDEDKIVSSVLAVTKSAETSLQMGNYGADRIREQLSEETMYRNLREIYLKILEEPLKK